MSPLIESIPFSQKKCVTFETQICGLKSTVSIILSHTVATFKSRLSKSQFCTNKLLMTLINNNEMTLQTLVWILVIFLSLNVLANRDNEIFLLKTTQIMIINIFFFNKNYGVYKNALLRLKKVRVETQNHKKPRATFLFKKL